jgi:hypothetical protein
MTPSRRAEIIARARMGLETLHRHRHRLNADGTLTAGLEIEAAIFGPIRAEFDNLAIAADLAGEGVTVELRRTQLEGNVPWRVLDGDTLLTFERTVNAVLTAIEHRTAPGGFFPALIGIDPLLMPEDLTMDHVTPEERYRLLNHATWGGQDALKLRVRSPARRRWLEACVRSVAFESMNTSIQPHIKPRSLDEFAAMHNRILLVLAVLLALTANSPFLFGEEAWADMRWLAFHYGTRFRAPWNTGFIHDPLEFVASSLDPARFPPLLYKDPDHSVLPGTDAVSLGGGTAWWHGARWALHGEPVNPHLRIEARALPAGPTVRTSLGATAAVFGGALSPGLDRVWQALPDWTVARNLTAAAKYGIDAKLWWIDRHGQRVKVDACALALELLPMLSQSLAGVGCSDATIARYLGVIEAAAVSRSNGATWQVQTVRQLMHQGLSRWEALTEMRAEYLKRTRVAADCDLPLAS